MSVTGMTITLLLLIGVISVGLTRSAKPEDFKLSLEEQKHFEQDLILFEKEYGTEFVAEFLQGQGCGCGGDDDSGGDDVELQQDVTPSAKTYYNKYVQNNNSDDSVCPK